MFLKSIKARGFKSFARPVDFAFEPGITVVVGPNGSGKSNIADAVLWAMGEQSPSAVRGSSMQDVIFSGSDKMAPSGMAEVEIMIDNSSGILPIEFSEVLVSRRLHRDGEGSYYINKSPCRLIDVAELLSDAGLGRDGHSIISQGKVDLVLESKPVDRRAHIEEAAGLGKYKKRRRRAELKLEQVRRNLERLTDVEEELKASLRPLKRQATAAERSAKLDLQIAQAQARLLKGKLAALKVEMDEAQDASREAASRRAELERRLAATAQERRRTEEQLAESLKDHQQRAARYYGLKSQLDSLAHRRGAVEERGEMLTQAAGRAEGRIGYLKGQIERAAAELKRAQEDHIEQQARMLELDAELAAHQDKLAELDNELGRRRRASEEKTRRVGELAALRDRYSHQLEYLGQRMQKLEASLERDREKRESGSAELESAREQYREEEAVVTEWRGRDETAAARLAGIRDEYDATERRRQDAASELRRVAEDLQIAKARLTFISDSDRDRSGFPPAAKKISEDYGVRALVDMLEVEPGYEKAVSAVLGSAIFALAAGDIGAAAEMLAAAREARLGSIEFILPSPPGSEGEEAGGDRLLDHVKVPPEASFIIPMLKGFRFVEEPSDAERPGTGGSWVTRDGVVFNAARGLLSYKADPPSSVVLKQRNEKRLLDQERDRAESSLGGLEQKMEKLTAELERLGVERDRLEQEQRETAARLREAENRVAGTARRCTVLEQEGRLVESSLSRLEAEKEGLEAEQQEAGRRLAEAEAALAQVQPPDGAAGAVDDETLATQRHSLAQQVTDLQIAAARARERERVSGATIERTGPALERLVGDRDIAAMQLAAYTTYGPVCERLAAVIGNLIEAHDQAAARLEAELKEAEEVSNSQSRSLRELSQAETGLQQELSRASDMTTDREVSVTRLRDHFEDLEARLGAITGRFPDAGLVELEAAAEDELEEVEEQVERLMRRRELIGPVNPLAQQEYEELLERQKFLEEQRADLEKSLRELTGLIRELTNKIEGAFTSTFEKVQQNFGEVVETLFPGGEGRLTLTDESDAPAEDGEDDGEAEEEALTGTTKDRRGVEISVKLPRKAVRSLSLFSGGERSLVAIAFLFSIFLARPAPFYILDEVEAALDDQNITRLLGMLRRFQDRTQFIVITHQKRTMEVADVLYGVSMGEDGTSKVLSRRMVGEGDGGPGEGTRQQTLEADLEPAAAAG